MTPQTLLRAQLEFSPREPLGKFAGKWVTLRDGHVVASSADLTSLPVEDGDIVMPVPVTAAHL